MSDAEMGRVIDRIEAEASTLSKMFEGFSDAEWARPTKCAGWTARHIAAHLAMGNEFYAGTIGNALRGDTSPLWTPDQAKLRAAELERRQQQPPEQLLDDFATTTKALLAVYQGLRQADYDRPTWHRLGILPLRWFIPARLGEIVLHRWDIEAMTQPGTQLSEASVPYLVDYLLETLPYRYKQVAAPNVPTVFGFEIGSQRYLLVATPERLQIGGTSRADVTFKLSPEAAALLFSGRLPLMQAIAAKLIEVDGNAEQARDFADLIQTF